MHDRYRVLILSNSRQGFAYFIWRGASLLRQICRFCLVRGQYSLNLTMCTLLWVTVNIQVWSVSRLNKRVCCVGLWDCTKFWSSHVWVVGGGVGVNCVGRGVFYVFILENFKRLLGWRIVWRLLIQVHFAGHSDALSSKVRLLCSFGWRDQSLR